MIRRKTILFVKSTLHSLKKSISLIVKQSRGPKFDIDPRKKYTLWLRKCLVCKGFIVRIFLRKYCFWISSVLSSHEILFCKEPLGSGFPIVGEIDIVSFGTFCIEWLYIALIYKWTKYSRMDQVKFLEDSL